jgi:hypothetical protein
MKTFKILSLLILLGIITSCEKDEIFEEKSNSDLKRAAQVDLINEVALEHNKGLDYIYYELKKAVKKGVIKVSNKQEFYDYAYKSNLNFYRNHFLVTDYNAAVDLSKEIYDYVSITYPLSGSQESQMWLGLDDGVLTQSQKNILLSLESDIDRANSFDDVIDALNAAKILTNNTPFGTIEEATRLLYAFEVGLKSAEYWNANYAKWKTFNNSLVLSKKVDWLGVGISDCRGALRGFFAGGPQGALIGGLGSSACAVLCDIIFNKN